MNSQVSVNAVLHDKINLRGNYSPAALNRAKPAENPEGFNPNIATQDGTTGETQPNPITPSTASTGNSNLFMKQSNNRAHRPISPAVLDTAGRVAVRGEKVIELGTTLHEQIKAKVDTKKLYPKPENGQTSYAPPHDFASLAKNQVQVQTPPSPESHATNEHLKNQLEEINKVLFEQIKQRISAELTRQKAALSTVAAPNKPSPQAAQTEPKLVPPKAPVPTLSPMAAGSQPVIHAGSPPIAVSEAPKPQVLLKEVVPPTQTQLQTQTKTASQEVSKITPPQAATAAKEPDFSAKEYKDHITKLEAEIDSLNKEVNNLDQTMNDLEKESKFDELSAMERKIEVDQRMLRAVGEWRLSLNNLINSHTVALKYLKQKTDWLEAKVEQIASHGHKHENLHRKPKEISLNLPTYSPGFSELDAVVGAADQSIKTALTPTAEQQALSAPTIHRESTVNQPESQKGVPISAEQKTEVIQKPTVELTEEQLRERQAAPFSPNGRVVEQQTVIIKPQTATVVEPKEEKQVSPEEVDKLVQEALERERKTRAVTEGEEAEKTKETLKGLVKEVVTETKPAETPKVEPDKEALKTMVDQAVKDAPAAAPVNVTVVSQGPGGTVPTGTPVIQMQQSQSAQNSDIERQILEIAAKEETEREIKRIATEAAQKHFAEGAAKTVQQKIESTVNQTATSVAPEIIKSEFDRVKADLTRVDNKNLDTMSKTERSELMHKIDTLEKQSLISKQFDDLKAAAERKRINAELQAMLTRLGDKPTSTPQTEEANAKVPSQQMETLKIQEKKEKTPEQKAKVIAEIKELERTSQARKAAEAMRPVVKAQPAFGKMLLNTPTIPNVINGIVKDAKGLLLATVVIIVKDKNGDPVRAFKTNKIGQFALSTPVPNGTYILELEKEGYEFDIIEVEVNGSVMQPIEIKAR